MKKTLTAEKLEYLQTYIDRQFALKSKAKTENTQNWLKDNGLDEKGQEAAKRELTSAGSTALLAWSKRWMTDGSVKKFETAFRQHVFHQKQKMVTFRIKEETHKKLVAYAGINNLKLSETIDMLLAAACKGNGL